jgi:phosphatidate phosphatase
MLNFLLLILLALPIKLLDIFGSPTERGFFIDDDSLSYPYKMDTVPDWLLYTMGFSIPIVLILIGNLCVMRSSSRENIFESLKHSYTMIILYLLGKRLLR